MEPKNNIEQRIINYQIRTNAEADKKILTEILDKQQQCAKSIADKSCIHTWRTIMKSPILKLAAAVVIVIAVIIASQLDVLSTPAFARVIEKVTNAQSVKFLWKQKIGQKPAILSKVYIQGNIMRLDIIGAEGQQQGVEQLQKEMERRNLSALFSTIADLTAKEALELDQSRKTYKRRELDEETVAAFTQSNLIEQFRNVKHEDAEKLREESQDGREIDVYRVGHVELMGFQGELAGREGEQMTVWIDRRSSLPIRILLEVSTHVEGKSRDWFDFSEFYWNEPISEDILSLEVPQGYKAAEPQDIDGQFD